MSIKVMAQVFEQSQTRMGARLVLLALADNASDEGVCWPSIATIARKAALSEQVTREYLHALEEIGLITASDRFGEKNRQKSNMYNIRVEMIGKDAISPEVLRSVKPPSRQKTPPLPVSEGSNPGETGEGIPGLEGGRSHPGERRIIIPNRQSESSKIPANSEVGRPSSQDTTLSLSENKTHDLSDPHYVDIIGDDIEEEINPSSRKAQFAPKDDLGQRILDGLWGSKSWASAVQLRAWNKAKDKFPSDWVQYRFEQAQKHRWSRQGFLKAILNKDAFKEWAGVELRRLSQTGGGLTERAKRLRQSLEPELPRREARPSRQAREAEQKTPITEEEIPF